MLGLQHACHHSLACQHQLCLNLLVDASPRQSRVTVAGSRLTLQSRALHVQCSSNYSNNVVSVRTAATSHAQLACEPSTVQDLLAHVVHNSTQHQQQTLEHAIDLRRQHNGHFAGVEDDLPSGFGTAGTPAVQELQQTHQQGDQQWPVFHQYQRQVSSLNHGMVQQMQLHVAPDAAEELHLAVQVAAADCHLSATGELLQHQQLHQYQPSHQQQSAPQQPADALTQQADLLLHESGQLLEELQAADRQRSAHSSRPQPAPGWSKEEVVRGWRYSQQDRVARTAAGVAVLQLCTAAQPIKQAKQLLSWLRREQKVILSAAGASLAFIALQCIAQVQLMLQQQHPQYQLLVTTDFRSSRRPKTRGRCEVYNLTCSLQQVQHSDQSCHILNQRQLMQQPRGLQLLHHEVTGSQHAAQLDCDLAGHGQLLQHLQVPEPGAQRQPWCQRSVSSYQASGLRFRPGGLSKVSRVIAAEKELNWLENGSSSRATTAVSSSHLSSTTLHYPQLHQQHGAQHTWSCLEEVHHLPIQQQQPLQQQQQHRQQPRHRRRQQQQQGEAGQPVAALQQADLRGTTVSIADMLDESLQQSAVVALPVPYAKQAVKVLEAAAIVSRRWQRRGGKTGSSVAVALQAWPGAAKQQSGSRWGLHVLLSSTPRVP